MVTTIEDDDGVNNDLNEASDKDSITNNNLKLIDDEIVGCEECSRNK